MTSADIARADTVFFGHPRAAGVLCAAHGFERAAFYGVQAVLMLYLTKSLLAAAPGSVLGLAPFRAGLSAIFGPLTDFAFASQVVGLFSGLSLIVPLLGSWLADRVLGLRRAVALGLACTAGGYALLAAPALFMPGLALVIAGAGLGLANLQAQVGALYAPGDPRRTRGYGLLLIALNAGALASPFVVGTLAELVGWPPAFFAAAAVSGVAFAVFTAGARHLPAPTRREAGTRAPLSPADRRALAAIILTYLPALISFACIQQAYTLNLVWADTAVDRTLGGFTVPVTWVLAFDGMGTILGAMLAARIWRALAARGREPGEVAKIVIGCLIGASAWAYLALVTAPSVPFLAWLGLYVLLDLAIPWVYAPSYALASRAPAGVTATAVALLTAAYGLGYFLLGWMGALYEPLGPARYWLLLAAVCVGAALTAVAMRPLVRRFAPTA